MLQLSVNGTVDVLEMPFSCTPVGLLVDPAVVVSCRGRLQQALRLLVPVSVNGTEQFVFELGHDPDRGVAVTTTLCEVEPEGGEGGAW